MASGCEILIETSSKSIAKKITSIAQNEAMRIEHKFSRYKKNNIVYQINSANGEKVSVDDETARLLDYASHCYELSNGLFDITSGVLREVWKFDGSSNIPNEKEVDAILPRIGWDKVNWKNKTLKMQPGMQIDFGGLGKEYAVDRTASLIKNKYETPALINYGGDISVTSPRQNGRPWEIGLQNPDNTQSAIAKVELFKGGVATSGDLNRYLVKNNIRYTHILNPKTGWPIDRAPRQVTVLADTCIDAGMLSTFAILQGENAESFLAQQNVESRIIY